MEKTKKLKVLNCYGGLGGNRKLWDLIPDVELDITAVEYKQKIADIYKDFFPNDKVVVGDAHQYLLDHYKEFDFIWTSPPCPSHSRVRKAGCFFKDGKQKQVSIYPDMKLYEEVLFLQGYFKGKYCVENVISWYKPLISPQEVEGHYYWANYLIAPYVADGCREHDGTIEVLQKRKGFNIEKYKNIDKRLALRNCVEPELGKHILECALGLNKQKTLL